jgi:hypothetical protein
MMKNDEINQTYRSVLYESVVSKILKHYQSIDKELARLQKAVDLLELGTDYFIDHEYIPADNKVLVFIVSLPPKDVQVKLDIADFF